MKTWRAAATSERVWRIRIRGPKSFLC